MSLILDDREDAALSRLMTQYDVPVSVARLEFGDACWEGNGPNGRVMVGVERKHLNDVVASMTDRRLSGHQLRGMWQTYDYCYLLVEDIWRPGEHGEIEINRNGKWVPFYSNGNGCTYRQVQGYLSTLEVAGNVIVLRSTGIRETAAIYASRVHWWAKKWADHHSHDEIYAPGPETARTRGKASFISRTPTLTEKIAAQLPGIDRKAWEIGARFETAREFLEWAAFSGAREWEQMPGIGKDGAKVLERALDERRGK
jgi:ERCC4-type nuclease